APHPDRRPGRVARQLPVPRAPGTVPSRTDAPASSRRQVTVTSALNSEVSPEASTLTVFVPRTAVAVADTTHPAGPPNGTSAANEPLPVPSVVTVVYPRYTCPWPCPLGSAVGLANNSTRYVVRD